MNRISYLSKREVYFSSLFNETISKKEKVSKLRTNNQCRNYFKGYLIEQRAFCWESRRSGDSLRDLHTRYPS